MSLETKYTAKRNQNVAVGNVMDLIADKCLIISRETTQFSVYIFAFTFYQWRAVFSTEVSERFVSYWTGLPWPPLTEYGAVILTG